MDVIFCNSFEVSHSREAFVLTFNFEAPDGKTKTVYVVLPPSGTVVLRESLEEQLAEYIKKFGNIVLGNWKKGNCNGDCNNDKRYIT